MSGGSVSRFGMIVGAGTVGTAVGNGGSGVAAGAADLPGSVAAFGVGGGAVAGGAAAQPVISNARAGRY